MVGTLEGIFRTSTIWEGVVIKETLLLFNYKHISKNLEKVRGFALIIILINENKSIFRDEFFMHRKQSHNMPHEAAVKKAAGALFSEGTLADKNTFSNGPK